MSGQSFEKRKVIFKPHTIHKNKLQMGSIPQHKIMRPHMYGWVSSHLGLEKVFLTKTQNPNVIIIFKKTEEFDYMKCKLKNHELVKRQVQNWKKTLAK